MYLHLPFSATSACATVILAMAKRTSKQQDHSWAVYHIRGTRAQFVGIVDAPDEQSAIEQAIEGVQGAGESTQPADRSAAGLS
jgi:hypothetical protein